MTVLQDQNLTPSQFLMLTHAMLAVAKADGFSPEEEALIRQFYDGARTGDLPSTEAMLADESPFDVGEWANTTPEFAEMAVSMCLMTAYADGNLSESEAVVVEAVVQAVAMSKDRYALLIEHVKDALVGSLAHLPDSASVAAIASKL